MVQEVVVKIDGPSSVLTDVDAVAAQWLDGFGRVLTGDLQAGVGLFAQDGWWRDILAFTWDYRSLHGFDAMVSALEQPVLEAKVVELQLMQDRPVELLPAWGGVADMVKFAFTFATRLGTCRGMVKLIKEDGAWRARTVLTEMLSINGHEERTTTAAKIADTKYRRAQRGRALVSQENVRRTEFMDEDPVALVIGGGHTGLQIAARLERLGIPTLVAERNRRIGDTWRNRYEGLFLHSTIFTDHFPYMPYPDDWPIFQSKENLANWLEVYANAMRLRVWTGTEVVSVSWDESSETWDVTLVRDGERRSVRVSQLICSTGVVGKPFIPEISGQDAFRGGITHADQHSGAPETVAGKKVVVVGAATTAMDIAQNAYEFGAEKVTMIQRGPTYVMRPSSAFPVIFGDYLDQPGHKIGAADFEVYANPYKQIMGDVLQEATRIIADADRELLDGLERAGFGVTLGPNNAGLTPIVLERAGGYYFDKGCLQLIVDGDVAVERGEIARFDEHAVVLSDGSVVEADLVVFATGYTGLRDYVTPILGEKVMAEVGPIWGLDEEGEIRGAYRPSGHPKLWFTAGGLLESRRFGGHLALQIKASELGLS